MSVPRPPSFCGRCGSCIVGTVDPYTGDVLVEVEVHAVPDDVMGLAPEHVVAIEDDHDYQRFLSDCAADCRCCSCCQQVPCAGATTSGFCDRFDCVRDDAYVDHWDSYDDFEQPS